MLFLEQALLKWTTCHTGNEVYDSEMLDASSEDPDLALGEFSKAVEFMDVVNKCQHFFGTS